MLRTYPTTGVLSGGTLEQAMEKPFLEADRQALARDRAGRGSARGHCSPEADKGTKGKRTKDPIITEGKVFEFLKAQSEVTEAS